MDRPYPALTVEIDYVEPYSPSRLALDELRRVLETYTVKESIHILEPTPIPAQSGSYTGDDLLRIHDEYVTAVEGGDTATIHVLYLNGRMKERDALGAKFFDDAIALFPMYYDSQPLGPARLDYSGLDLNREEYERSVLIHEVGHLMGLVNCGIPMVTPHMDPDYPCHSSERDSVMYFAVDLGGGDLRNPLEGGFTYKFDDADKRDLFAFIEHRRATSR